MPRLLAKFLLVAGIVWTWAVLVLTAWGYLIVWRDEGFWAMVSYVDEWTDPFSLKGIINFAVILAALSPGILAVKYGQKWSGGG